MENKVEHLPEQEVRIAALLPNPFRDLQKYPLDEEKVQDLLASMERDKFWGRIAARPTKDGKYELAFGHHRLGAAKRLWGLDALIKVEIGDFQDIDMVRMMTCENMNDSGNGYSERRVEAVAQVYDLLNGILAEHEFFEEVEQCKISALAFTNAQGFGIAKGHGSVGAKSIANVLGPPWTINKIDYILRKIKIKEKEENGKGRGGENPPDPQPKPKAKPNPNPKPKPKPEPKPKDEGRKHLDNVNFNYAQAIKFVREASVELDKAQEIESELRENRLAQDLEKDFKGDMERMAKTANKLLELIRAVRQ